MNRRLPDIHARKAELRTQLKSIRASVQPEAYDRFSERICEQLKSMDLFTKAKWIHTFWPLIESREPDIRSFIAHLVQSSVRVALPVLRPEPASGQSSKRIRQIEYDLQTTMTRNLWGIHEPEGERFVSKEEIDVVIVPALGVDGDGFRIGYGGGYYDEFLSGMNVTMVCPIFSCCMIENIPRETHDIPVHFIVTEAGPIAASKT